MPTWARRWKSSRSSELFCVAISSSLRCTESFSAAASSALAPADLAATVASALGIAACGGLCPESALRRERLAAARRFAGRRRADHLRQQTADVFAHWHRPKARYAVGIVEVPVVLDQADEVANRRIGGPSATKRRTREIRRARRVWRKARMSVFGADRFDRRQAGGIEWRPRRGRLRPRSPARRRRVWRASFALGRRRSAASARFAFAPRPSIEEIFRLAHVAHRRARARAAPALPDRRDRACV